MRWHILLIIGWQILFSVQETTAQNIQILTVEKFIQQVKQFHPVAKQAGILVEKADASLLAAKGSFDPVFSLDQNNKTLDGTNYYRYNNAELKIPTRLPFDFKAGYETSNGAYLNPELTKGVASYMGVEIPLLQGFLTDKKRTGLQQAKIFKDQSSQEKNALLNDLLFEAYVAYWQWAGSYELYLTYSNYVDVAGKRARLVKLTYENGDRAMVDTIEAFAQVQNFRLMQTEALLELKNTALSLSQYLWTEDTNPYLLPDLYIPDTIHFERLFPLSNLDDILLQVAQSHPEIRIYEYKLDMLELERKLKFQSLLPIVNLKANLLSKAYFEYKGLSTSYLENNYKLGVNIKVPLFARQGRGDYKNVQLKLKEATLQRSDKLWILQNKISQYYNEAKARQEQLEVATSMFRSYSDLLRVEELKFSQGESSLFLINSRENKVLEMQQKLIELRVKYLKAHYAIDWASGTIG